MRVLVVEDEPKIAALLRRGLVEEGHPTDVATSGEDALWMVSSVFCRSPLSISMIRGSHSSS